ncbi:MAG: hypothetical protein NT154_15750 [Verrucomicrobia bacterium]|nr:hypothetical protein [Verrucomicrobiota bacterium]
MKSKPVRKYAQPKYPTRLEIAACPALLYRHQPPAWRKWPELTGAAGLFLLADAARLPAADGAPKGSQNPVQTNAVAIVAPIFQHGEGRGATGCIVMSPPVFLSEEEALQVIREEMAGKGVQLGNNQTTLAGVTVERGRFSVPAATAGATKGTQPARPTFEIKQEPFKTDAADPKKNVFVEFLSERDANQWDLERAREERATGGTNSAFPFSSSVRSYDMTNTAGYVAERVRRQATDKVYLGTFYDPLAGTLDFSKLRAAKSEPNFKAVMAEATLESRRLLRLQVQDFLKWLQAQGAI